jgi:hypothetical protein
MPLKLTITGERAASAASATASSASANPPDSATCALEMSAVQAGSPIRPVSTTSARCRRPDGQGKGRRFGNSRHRHAGAKLFTSPPIWIC